MERDVTAEAQMIQLRSLAFGSFAEADPLNPNFVPGQPKLRLTVDASDGARAAEPEVLDRLVTAFPGLKRHRCQMNERPSDDGEGPRGIVLLPEEPSANQAHLLEHLLLEMLSSLDRAPRRSGVTCAYASAPERCDVFVECGTPGAADVAVPLAIEALNAGIAGKPVGPLFPDALRAAAVWIDSPSPSGWNAGRLAESTHLATDRARAVLELFRRVGLAAVEPYAMNWSGEPAYRMTRRRK
ncbi:MAG TPA: hypothetical protein VID50_10455 [Candidatus Eisenbacteria bacterium]|jgi:hypothetical protein